MGQLHQACLMGDLKQIKALVVSGHDINELDADGYTPLFYLQPVLDLFSLKNYVAPKATDIKALNYLWTQGARFADKTTDLVLLEKVYYQRPHFLIHFVIEHFNDFNFNGLTKEDVEYFFQIPLDSDTMPEPKHLLSQRALHQLATFMIESSDYLDFPKQFVAVMERLENKDEVDTGRICAALTVLIQNKSTSYPNDPDKVFELANKLDEYLERPNDLGDLGNLASLLNGKDDYWICLETALIEKANYYVNHEEYNLAKETYSKLLHLNAERLININKASTIANTSPSEMIYVEYADNLGAFSNEIDFTQWSEACLNPSLEKTFLDNAYCMLAGFQMTGTKVKDFYKLYFSIIEQSTDPNALRLLQPLRDYMHILNYTNKWQDTNPAVIGERKPPPLFRAYLSVPKNQATFNKRLFELETLLKKIEPLNSIINNRVAPLISLLGIVHEKDNIITNQTAEISSLQTRMNLFAAPFTQKRPHDDAEKEDLANKRQRTLDGWLKKKS